MNTQKIRPINQTTFHILYFKYKIYFVPIGALLVAVILLLYLIIPEVQQWYADQSKIASLVGKISVLNQSLNTVNNIGSKDLDTQLQTASSALPSGKDFIGVLNAISSAAQASGTSVGDYGFQVGDISKSQIPKDTFLEISVNLNGNVDHIRQFITSLKNQFPISRITQVNVSGNKTATISIIFFYKPFPQISFTGDDVLQPLTVKEQSLLSQLQRTAQNSFGTGENTLDLSQ